MSYLIERFNNHSVHNSVNNVLKKTNELKKNDLKGDLLEDVLRFNQTANEIKRILDSIDPYLISINNMNSIQKYLNSGLSNLNAYIKNKNKNNLNQFRNNLEAMLSQIGNINNIKTPEDVNGLREDISNFRKSIGQHNKNIEEEYNNIKNKEEEIKGLLNEFEKDIKVQQERADSIEKEIQNAKIKLNEQFIESQNERNNNYEKFKNDIKDEINQIQRTFNKSTDEIEDKFLDAQRNFENNIDNKINEFEDKLKKEQQNILEDLEIYKEKAIKIVGIIGNTGTTGAYKKAADYERNISYIWHAISVISIVALIIYGIQVFPDMLNKIDSGFNWAMLGWRVFVTSAFGSLFAYAAKQANKYSAISEKNRRMELELASIGPYLAELDDEVQQQIKEELSRKLFGNHNLKSSEITKENDEVVVIPSNIAQLIVKTLGNEFDKYINK